MLKVGFIGAGTVGTALAVLLNRKGYEIAGASRLNKSARESRSGLISNLRILDSNQAVADAAEIVFITTPDDAIAAVANEVKWRRGQSVVHCSGADSLDILENAGKSGAMVGGFHPLQTFAGVKQAIENIPGSTVALEAEEPLLATLKKMAEDLDCDWIILKAEDKVAYHAAAVFACNYAVTLVKMATDLWDTFSIPQEVAIKALLPLIRGTLHNIETVGIPQCLTGPIARGDKGTIRKHLAEIRQKAPELLFPYKELALQTLPIALAKGKIKKQQARELELILRN
ncbi:MAG: DUF2520 domain-containing protein [Dehalococcoidales bacterium]|nr:DUF2520 domain-containing protein [Dehalococcoidales bacterium]